MSNDWLNVSSDRCAFSVQRSAFSVQHSAFSDNGLVDDCKEIGFYTT
jgi:hypothetical protein